jgi:HSP20 family molecular chaperone IbpA
MSVERKEDVTIDYKGGKITVTGKSFKVEAAVSSSELSKVYWGNTGKGQAKVTVQDAEAVAPKA